MRKFSVLVKLAWRNVWRNKRRTVLTLLTVLVGCSMIIFMNAIAKGGHDQMIIDAVSVNTGEIQIHEKGYWDSRTIDYAFEPGNKLLKDLDENRRIAGFTRRVVAQGMLAYKNATAGAMIQGIDPEREKEVTDIHLKVLPGGRYLKASDRKNILMGHILAKNLGISVGQTLAMLSQGFDGSIAAEKLTVAGLFNSGNPEYDHGLIIMPLVQAMETFSMMGYIHAIVIKLHSLSDMEGVRASILGNMDPGTMEVLGWDKLMPELVQFIVMDNVSAYIFDFILFMIVAFGIMNTINLSVFERTREFGVMLSIGTRPGQVVSMVMLESFFISLLGIFVGLAAGYALSYYFQVHPINYSEYSEEIAVWGIATTIYPADATGLNLTVTSILTLGLSLLFSLWPARRASRLNPIEAIRHL